MAYRRNSIYGANKSIIPRPKGWRKIRDRVMARDGYLCRACNREGYLTALSLIGFGVVDHIVPRHDPRWQQYDMPGDSPKHPAHTLDNLQSLYPDCHNIKSAKETVDGKNMSVRKRHGATPCGHPYSLGICYRCNTMGGGCLDSPTAP